MNYQIPVVLLLQTSSASLGSLTLYRSSIQSVVFAVGQLFTTTRMAFQGIFLMGAFCAAMKIKPRLHPKDEEKVAYRALPGGVRIQARCAEFNSSIKKTRSQLNRGLSYTYPGSNEPALRDVSFSLEPGESLAIVGYNGSGKSYCSRWQPNPFT